MIDFIDLSAKLASIAKFVLDNVYPLIKLKLGWDVSNQASSCLHKFFNIVNYVLETCSESLPMVVNIMIYVYAINRILSWERTSLWVKRGVVVLVGVYAMLQSELRNRLKSAPMLDEYNLAATCTRGLGEMIPSYSPFTEAPENLLSTLMNHHDGEQGEFFYKYKNYEYSSFGYLTEEIDGNFTQNMKDKGMRKPLGAMIMQKTYTLWDEWLLLSRKETHLEVCNDMLYSRNTVMPTIMNTDRDILCVLYVVPGEVKNLGYLAFHIAAALKPSKQFEAYADRRFYTGIAIGSIVVIAGGVTVVYYVPASTIPAAASAAQSTSSSFIQTFFVAPFAMFASGVEQAMGTIFTTNAAAGAGSTSTSSSWLVLLLSRYIRFGII